MRLASSLEEDGLCKEGIDNSRFDSFLAVPVLRGSLWR